MSAISLPRVGDILFLEQCEVVVTKVLTCFHIVEICRSGKDSKLYVDAGALTSTPGCAFSISIKYFGRGGDE
jgi:hypothetical protein